MKDVTFEIAWRFVQVAGVQEVSQAFSEFLGEYLAMLCNWHINSDMVDVAFLHDLSWRTHDMAVDCECEGFQVFKEVKFN